jgi:LEA14-like dessication related protein
MKFRKLAVVLASALALSIPACNRVRAPDVELIGVRFAGIGFQGIALNADLSIVTPNKFAMEADSVTFKLEAGDPNQPGTWVPVTTGTQRAAIRVEGGGRNVVAVPIEFAYSDLGTSVRSILGRGTLEYRVSGRVWVRKPIRIPVPFRHTGNVSIAQAK